ncbi:chaperone protein ClpB1 [Trifolium repens]|nr:chaperone protein ClpB1 [Trifolium repens]
MNHQQCWLRRQQWWYVFLNCWTGCHWFLRGLKEKYEGHHDVRIQDHAIVVAAQLSSRYITGRRLPNEACANARVQLDSQPEEIDNLERKRMQLGFLLFGFEFRMQSMKEMMSDRAQSLIRNATGLGDGLK